MGGPKLPEVVVAQPLFCAPPLLLLLAAPLVLRLPAQLLRHSMRVGPPAHLRLCVEALHLARPGADSIVVEDWDTGESVTIPLDPLKTPVAAAEALYARARKQRRAVAQVAPLVEDAQAQVEYLQEVELMLQQLNGEDSVDAESLRQTEAELVAGGFLKAQESAVLAGKAAAKARRATKKGKQSGGGSGDSEGFRKYTSPSGLSILVGRNSAQNDVLSTRMAQPRDVWMHARAVPGAHLLLRVPAGQTPTQEDLQYAADIAAYFSKSRTNGKADVTLASPADITKPSECLVSTRSFGEQEELVCTLVFL